MVWPVADAEAGIKEERVRAGHQDGHVPRTLVVPPAVGRIRQVGRKSVRAAAGGTVNLVARHSRPSAHANDQYSYTCYKVKDDCFCHAAAQQKSSVSCKIGNVQGWSEFYFGTGPF